MIKKLWSYRILYLTVLLVFILAGTFSLLNYSGVFAGDNSYTENFSSLTHSATEYSGGVVKLVKPYWMAGDGTSNPGAINSQTTWTVKDMALDSSGYGWVVATDTSDKLYLTRFDGADWVDAAGTGAYDTISAATSYSPRVLIDGSDNVYVFWYDATDFNVAKWNGAAWGNMGAAVSINSQLVLAGTPITYEVEVDSTDNPNILFQLIGVDSGLYFTKWSGAAWVDAAGVAGKDTVAGAGVANGQLKLDGLNNPFVSWYDNIGSNVYFTKWDGGGDNRWEGMDNIAGNQVVDNVNAGTVYGLELSTTNMPHITWTKTTSLYETHWDSVDGRFEKMDATAGIDTIILPHASVTYLELKLDTTDLPYFSWASDDNGDTFYEKVYLTHWDGAQWGSMSGVAGNEDISALDGSGSKTYQDVELAINSATNKPYIFFVNDHVATETPFYAYYDGSNWISADTTTGLDDLNGSTAVAGDFVLSSTNVPYVAFTSGSADSSYPFFGKYSSLFALSGNVLLATNANTTGNIVTKATLTATADATGGTITYSMSSDGGGSWAPVSSGTQYVFDQKGTNLLWKVAFTSTDGSATPSVSAIGIDYSSNSAPGTPSLSAPADSATAISKNPTFTFSSTDTDSDNLYYVLEIGMTDDMLNGIWKFDQREDNYGWTKTVYSSGATASFTLPSEYVLDLGKTYYYTVRAYDVNGLASSVSSIYTFTITEADTDEYTTNLLTMEGIDLDNSTFSGNYGKNKVVKLPTTNSYAAAAGALGSSTTLSLELIDGNGDEIVDVLEFVSGNSIYHENNGSASFSATTTNCGDSYGVVFDVDNDGDLDFASGLNSLVLCINNGAGSFTASSSLGNATVVDGLRAGDLNNDGYTDVTNGEQMFINNKVGSLVLSGTTFGTGIAVNDKFELFDIDNDGDDDLVYVDWVAGGVRTLKPYTNDGAGSFSAAATVVLGAMDDPVVTDFDHDGDKDLVFQPEVSGTMSALINNGSGTFTQLNDIVTGDNCVDTAWKSADLDGDGFEELICGSANGTQNYIYRHPGKYSFTYAVRGQVEYEEEAAFGTYHGADFVVADFDRDGDSDVVLGANGQNYYYANTANSYGSTDLIAGESVLAVFDSDNDGDMDLYVNNNGAQNELWVNDGALSYTQTGSFGTVNSYAAMTADLDGDGDMDVVEIGYGGLNTVYLNSGSNLFTGTSLGAGTDNSIDVKLADADLDGDLDIFIANYGAKDELWLNNGSGSFSAQTNPFGINTYNTGKFDVGDVDGDGDVDVVFPYTDAGIAGVVFTNDGSASFSSANVFANESFVVRLGDLDQDGDLDAVLADNASGAAGNYIYVNTGSGSFTQTVAFNAGTDTRDIHLADADLDGDLDIFVANGNAGTEADVLYKNLGNFNFSYTTIGVAAKTESILAADYDLDGDIDFYANYLSGVASRRFEYKNTYTAATNYTVLSSDVYDGDDSLTSFTLSKTDYTPVGSSINYYVQDTADASYSFGLEDTTGLGVDMNQGEVGVGMSFVVGDAGNNGLKVGAWADLDVGEGVNNVYDYWSGVIKATNYSISVGDNGTLTTVDGVLAITTDLCGGTFWDDNYAGDAKNLYEIAVDSNTEHDFYIAGEGGTLIYMDVSLADGSGILGDIVCEAESSGTVEDLNSVWVSDDSSAILAVGNSGTIIGSTDSGATWGDIVSGTSENLNHIEMSNNWFTVVGDNGTIIKSSDGTTWSTVSSCATAENLNWVRNENATNFLAVGDNDTYVHTENNGTSCTVGTTGVAGVTNLNSIDDDEDYVYGDNDKLLNFTFSAGGSSFQSVTPDTPYTFNAGTTTLIWKAIMATTDVNVSPYISALNFDYSAETTERRVIPGDVLRIPQSPNGLAGVALSAKSIQWTWNHSEINSKISGVSVVDGFYFYDKESDSLLQTLAKETEKIESELTPNTLYRRKVLAYNAKGNSSLAADAEVYTFAAKPQILGAQKSSSNSAVINLDKNENPDYTKCAIYESKTSKWIQADGALGDSKFTQSFADWGSQVKVTGLEVLMSASGFNMSAGEESTTYSFMAIAENEAGTETDFSDPVEVEITGVEVDSAILAINKTVSLYNPAYAFNFAKSASASGLASGDKLLKAVDNSIKFTNGVLWTIFGILFLFVMLIMANATGTIKQKIKYLHKILFKSHKQEDAHDVYQVINSTNEPLHNNRYYRHHSYSRVTGVVMVGFVVGIIIKVLLGGFLTFLVYSDIGTREFVEAADANVEVGDVLQYRVDYSNAEGAGDAVNLVIEDAIPANTEYKAGSVVTSLGEVVGNPGASGVVQVVVDSLSPGQSGYVTFNVEILETASVGVSISNQSKIKDDNNLYIFSNTTSNTVVATLSCGDDICSEGESCSTCLSDCGSCQEENCGNGICSIEAGETCDSCSADCGVCQEEIVCGDSVCSDSETCSSCSSDCGACQEDYCGNGQCSATESCSSCSSDCGSCEEAVTCGDGVCTKGEESCSSCQSDCGVCYEAPFCGDGYCRADLGETCSSCSNDCGECEQPYCGDGSCSANESCSTCETDCNKCSEVEICGNGICSAENGENTTNCSIDCGNLETSIYCGDNLCDVSEACGTCSTDCGVCSEPNCGDGICSANEDNLSCGMDCGGYEIEGYYCGDSVCQETEKCFTCSADCGACSESHCGDGMCSEGEDYLGCFSDCGGLEVGEYCGDSVCSEGESCSSCQSDCGNCKIEYCGNGICSIEIGENISSCAKDCGSLETDNYCGDLVCSNNESCLTCSSDCGACKKQCSDKIDNDNDGLIDYPFDLDCINYLDDNEWPSLEAIVPACADGIDNDNDGFVDYPDDSGCSNYMDGNETSVVEVDIVYVEDEIYEDIIDTLDDETDLTDEAIDEIGEEIEDANLSVDDLEDILDEILEDIEDGFITEEEIIEIIEDVIDGVEDLNDIEDILVEETDISDEVIEEIIDLITDFTEEDQEDIAEELIEEVEDTGDLTEEEVLEIIDEVSEDVEDINDIEDILVEETDISDEDIEEIIDTIIDLTDGDQEDIAEELIEEVEDTGDLTEEEVLEIIDEVINDQEDLNDLEDVLEEIGLDDGEIEDIIDEIIDNELTDEEIEEIIENIEDANEDGFITDGEIDDIVDDVTGDLEPEDVIDAIEDLTDDGVVDDEIEEIIEIIEGSDLTEEQIDEIVELINDVIEEDGEIDIDEIEDIINDVVVDPDVEDLIDAIDEAVEDVITEDELDEIIDIIEGSDLTEDEIDEIVELIEDVIEEDGEIDIVEIEEIIEDVTIDDDDIVVIDDLIDVIDEAIDDVFTEDELDEIIDEIIENDLSDEDIADIIEELEEEFENIDDIDELTDEEIEEIISDVIDEVIADEEDLNDIEDIIVNDDEFDDEEVDEVMDEIIEEDLSDDNLEEIIDRIEDEIADDGDITPDELVDILDDIVDENTDMTNDRDTIIIYNNIDDKDEWDKQDNERTLEKIFETEEIMNSTVVTGTTKVVAKVVSRVTDISYRDAKKEVAKKLRVNVKVVKDIEKSTVDNPVIEKVNDVTREPAIATITVGAAASIATVGTTGAAGVGTLLQYLFTQPLFVLFSARRRKKWGTIYNAVTKKPVDLAIVRVYNSETKRIVRTQVTDKQGRYQFILDPGKYYMEVYKQEFKFPSKIAGHSVDSDLESIYHGGEFEIKDKDTSVVFGIALDPLKNNFTDVKLIKLFIMRRWQSGIVLVGPVLAIVSFVVNPQIWVGGLALAHLGSYLIFKRVAVSTSPNSYGVVSDSKEKTPLSHAVVRVFDTQYNKLLDSHVTDRFGRYAFLVGNEQYFITCDKPGYFPLRSQRYDLSNELSGYLAEDIAMQPHGFEDIEQAQKHNQPLTLRVSAGRQKEEEREGKKVVARRHAEKFTGEIGIEGVDLDEMHEDYYDVDVIDSDANNANKHANDANVDNNMDNRYTNDDEDISNKKEEV